MIFLIKTKQKKKKIRYYSCTIQMLYTIFRLDLHERL